MYHSSLFPEECGRHGLWGQCPLSRKGSPPSYGSDWRTPPAAHFSMVGFRHTEPPCLRPSFLGQPLPSDEAEQGEDKAPIILAQCKTTLLGSSQSGAQHWVG